MTAHCTVLTPRTCVFRSKRCIAIHQLMATKLTPHNTADRQTASRRLQNIHSFTPDIRLQDGHGVRIYVLHGELLALMQCRNRSTFTATMFCGSPHKESYVLLYRSLWSARTSLSLYGGNKSTWRLTLHKGDIVYNFALRLFVLLTHKS